MEYKLASSTWDDAEKQAMLRVIDSGNFSMGENVSLYESAFANFFGSKFAVMTSSGSTANLLMIASLFFTKNANLKLKAGDEIIVPAVSWSTTYFPLQQYGLKVKFVDIDPDTLNFNLDNLEEAITEKTRAILAVNLLGNPNDFNAINNMIDGKNIILLEDNCESMGASYDGVMAGCHGVMGTFSSYFSHHIATMEGGCIVTDLEEIYHILLCLRAHGWTRNLPMQNHVTGQKDTNFFEEAFKFVLPGYNVRPLEISGAIGIEQLKKLPQIIENRLKNAKTFKELFSPIEYVRIQREIGRSSWFGFSIILEKESPISRSQLIDRFNQADIEYRPIVTGNFVKNKDVLDYFDYEVSGSLIHADFLDKNGLFIGNHHTDVSDELAYVHSIFLDV